MTNPAKKHALRGIAEIDRDELTTRLLEIGCQMKRPAGQSGREAMANTRALVDAGKIPDYIVADFEKMADCAVRYLTECINNMKSIT